MIKTIEEIDDLFNSFTPSLGGGKLRENRLERMELILEKLGNPESSFSSYHIAGSKGKGTTASYLATIIEQSGRRCGLYMSPHVYDIRERFTEATSFFSDLEYLETANELIDRLKGFSIPTSLGPNLPTTFELYTAYGYLLFKNTGCSEAVIETGLGGRLDATNTLEPKAVIFTNIELEHTEILGSTFEEIANEKLGIMRKGVPTFYMQEELGALIKEKSNSYNVPLYYLKDRIDDAKIHVNKDLGYIEYPLETGGNVKISNESRIILLDALYSCYIATELGIPRKSHDIDLTDVRLPARFERTWINYKNKEIPIIFDGAHTPSSCHEALESLKRFIEGKDVSPILIFSAAEGKKIDKIGLEVFPYFKRIIVSGLGEFKKANPKKIESLAKDISPDSEITLNIDAKEAILSALEADKDNPCILVLGSFYLCAEIKNALKELGYVY